jgi:hypothetical protein
VSTLVMLPGETCSHGDETEDDSHMVYCAL